MNYFKKSISAILAVGVLMAPAAFAHGARVVGLNALINHNSTKNQASPFNWMNRITVGGIMHVDFVEEQRGWNVTGPATAGIIPNFRLVGLRAQRATDISINNANLLLDARVNSGVNLHLGVIYRDVPGPSAPLFGVDEAYVTLGRRDDLPFYMRVGREYIPIGSYEDPYPLTIGLVQLLTQTNATALQLGYASLDSGLYGMVYGFNSPFSSHVFFREGAEASYGLGEFDVLPRTTRVRNFGAKMGYQSTYLGYSYNVEASYLRDFRDTLFFLANELDPTMDQPGYVSGLRRAAIYALHAYVVGNAFDFLVDYTALTRRLDKSYPAMHYDRNTRMWAYSVRGGHWFNTLNYRSKVQVTYERAGHTVLTTTAGLSTGISRLNPARYTPRLRYIFDYIVNIGRRTSLGLQYTYARDFRRLVSGNGNNQGNNEDQAELLDRNSATTLKARLSVSF